MTTSSQKLHYLGLLGSAGLVSVLLILPDSLDSMNRLCGGYENVSIFLATSLLTAVVAGLLLSLFGILREQASIKGLGFGGLAAAGTLIAVHAAMPVAPNGLLFVLFGIVFGAGLAATAIQWGVVYSTLPQEKSIAWLSVSCLVAVPLKSLAIILGSQAADLAYLAVVVFSLLISSLAELFVVNSRAISDGEMGKNQVDRVKGMIGRNGILFCGLLLCLWVPGAVWATAVNDIATVASPGPVGTWGVSLGFMLSALILLLAAPLLKRPTNLLIQIAPLICITSLLLIWFLGSWEEGPGKLIANIPLGFAFALLGILVFVRFCTEARNGLPPLFVFGISASICAIVLLAAFTVRPFLGTSHGSSAHLTLEVVYLMAVAVYLIVILQRRVSPVETSEGIDTRCQGLSEANSLSKRESEILVMLAQGRSAPYIAEEMFISNNTVKTHIKRIYQKCNVHSKEELLDLIYNAD
jgi:DNA-binding CsgD family transcriptional regulator